MRFTENLSDVRALRDQPVPALPLETEPFVRPEVDDDHTVVDPPQPPPMAASRLPLRPPPDEVATRLSNPGTMPARNVVERAKPKPSVAPRPVPKPPPPPPRVRVEEQNTAVATDPLEPLRSPLIGGRYRLVKRIGEGGMGKVFKVTHAQLGKTFALKIIHNSVATDEKARESFFREARLASSLSHPNIASVVDFGEDREYGAFMVMEFLEGEMLSTALHRDKQIGLRQACDLMLQVGEALHYIHSHRIVHCDIKAENIMLCEVPGTKRRKQQLKLLDFGLARSTNAQRHTGSLSGTPHYVAPERIRGEPPTPQSDIYGLGILFYEMITGSVPWDGNVAQILCGHLEKQPAPPSAKLGEQVDPAVEQLIFKALKKDPAERHKDTSALIYELRTVMDMLGFGRRHKRGSRQKIVIERQPDERDELARTMFDHSRLPMALIASTGIIAVANAAFAKFVMGVSVDVEGLTVASTPLASAWSTFEVDLEKACRGESVRRVIEIDMANGSVRKLLMWLDPAGIDAHAAFGIHPIDLA